MSRESICPVCGEKTDTDFRQMGHDYVAHICEGCGADKRQDPSAPI